MILPDANLLIYAHNVDADRYEPAHHWLESILRGPEPVAFPWAIIHTFLRLTTSTRALPEPYTIEEAIEIVNRWMRVPATRIIEPGPRYWNILRLVLAQSAVRGKMVSDAHLAALAIEHDATLYTSDRDFRRFRGLRVVNPLT